MISCIIPVFNGERFLEQAISSVLAQNGTELEIIVVDDGSTDRSAEIARSFVGVLVVSQPNQGVAAARNRGVDLASGEFVAFLDADDVWLPGKLAAQLTALKSHADCDYCISYVQHVPMEGSAKVPGNGNPMLGRLTQCMLARRSVFEKIGRFDTGTDARSDQDWFIRAREERTVEIVIPEVFVHRRLHSNNLTVVNDATLGTNWLTIVRRTLKRRRAQGGAAVAAVEHWTPRAVE